MKFVPTKFPGCFEIFSPIHGDDRGALVKTFHEASFVKAGLSLEFKEQYYSISKKNVVRGLHFQTPPHDHGKLIYCIAGEVFDVALDIRVGSPTFGKYFSTILSSQKSNMLYLPEGFAHGFCTPNGDATMVYNVTTCYNPDSDTGIGWDTAGISWPVKKPNLSMRDLSFLSFKEFVSPFLFNDVN